MNIIAITQLFAHFTLVQLVGFMVLTLVSRDSIVVRATSYGLDDQEAGVRVPIVSRIFSTSSRPALQLTQPPIQWVLGALSRG
jgi:hypothetical protein